MKVLWVVGNEVISRYNQFMSDQGETITINESDIIKSSLRRAVLPQNIERIRLKTADFALDEQGREKEPGGVTVRLGIPVNEQNKIVIPNQPTLMLVDNLFCKDNKHNWILLQDQMVLFGHGRWNTDTEKWEMQNGTSVKQIVDAWERYAEENNLPNVGFIVACDTQSYEKYEPTLKEKLQGIFSKAKRTETSQKVMRNEIIVPTFQHGTVVESFGKLMRFYYGISDVVDGRSTMVVDVKDGEFSGLDNAILAQRIELN